MKEKSIDIIIKLIDNGLKLIYITLFCHYLKFVITTILITIIQKSLSNLLKVNKQLLIIIENISSFNINSNNGLISSYYFRKNKHYSNIKHKTITRLI